jgi:hypothetical protein
MVSSKVNVRSPSNFITAVTLLLKVNKEAFGGCQPGFCALIDSEKRKNPIKRKKILKLNLTKYIFFYLEK